jgi:4-carboxymuconolactone decarboxylase
VTHQKADDTFRDVMTADPPSATTPFQLASRFFLFGDVWARPGLTRRERRWVTLTCVAAADAVQPIEEQVYAALKSGDINVEAMLEFVLQFAVYCGWPKASHVEGSVLRHWARVQQELGGQPSPLPALDNETLGLNDWRARLERGTEEFAEVNLTPAPPPDTPYRHAGILNFVFGHVWMRPGLTRKERRIITVAAVAIDDSPLPLTTHVTSALHSGDISKEEMDEIVLQFAAYYGFAKGEALSDTVEAAWATRPEGVT